MSSIINLLYFAYEDTFYYIDILKLEPAYFHDFMDFYGDIIDGANTANPGKNIGLTYTEANPPESGPGVVDIVEIGAVGDPIGFYSKDTGECAIPFSQSLSLTNITAENVLTNFDAGTTYNFRFEVQNQDYQFSALGSALETWQDVVELVQNNTPATVEYYVTTKDNRPYIKFQSHVLGQPSVTDTGGGGGTTPAITSQIKVLTLANNTFTTEATSTASYADVDIIMDEPTASDILTRVASNDDTVFQFAIGKRKNLTVRGFQARTYQDVVDTINKFDDVNCLYRLDSSRKHVIVLYVPLPKSPKMSDIVTAETETNSVVITRNATLRTRLSTYESSRNLITIEDFSGLTTNSKILHDLGNSIYGGYTMLSVVQNSKRANGSYWTEVVAIQSDKLSADEVSSKVPEQAEIIAAIETESNAIPDMTPDIKRKMAIDLGSILKYAPLLAGGKDALKSELVISAIASLAGVIGEYFPPDFGAPPNDISTTETLQDTVIDDGYQAGALDAQGNVLDENLLTPAQKAKLVPPPRTTVT